ncbi:unnamed protein product [Meloidogyne enterolobii]|uniref:Uncharacterized protein n=1 Tax=Meloidogyne enterolobii TaxID=390850 RepID=A0ACB0ZKF4_MELEN
MYPLNFPRTASLVLGTTSHVLGTTSSVFRTVLLEQFSLYINQLSPCCLS